MFRKHAPPQPFIRYIRTKAIVCPRFRMFTTNGPRFTLCALNPNGKTTRSDVCVILMLAFTVETLHPRLAQQDVNFFCFSFVARGRHRDRIDRHRPTLYIIITCSAARERSYNKNKGNSNSKRGATSNKGERQRQRRRRTAEDDERMFPLLLLLLPSDVVFIADDPTNPDPPR